MSEYSWTATYRRIDSKRKAQCLSWEKLARKAGIKMRSWMTGLPNEEASDAELKKIAPPLKTTYKWLKWGEK